MLFLCGELRRNRKEGCKWYPKKKGLDGGSFETETERTWTITKKADFDCATCSQIKAFLGSWPRALEAAGLKEPKRDE